MMIFSNKKKITRYPNSTVIHVPDSNSTSYIFFPYNYTGQPYFSLLDDVKERSNMKGD